MYRVLAFLVLWICTNGHSTKDYLDKHCGETLSYQKPWVRLKLTRRDDYPPNMNCTVKVVFSDTEAGTPARIMVVVHKLETKCPGDRLKMLDGNSSLPLKGLSPDLCGKHEPKQALFTDSSSLVVNFQSDAYKSDDGFELYLTRFHLGICTPSEFRCARGPCIATSLRCDGHDQCGDDSDECPWKSWLVVSLVAATCLGSLLTAVVMCCCCSQYRSRFRRPRTRGRIIPSFARSQSSAHPAENDMKKSAEVQLAVPNLVQPPLFYSTSPPAYTETHDVTSVDKSGGPLPTKSAI